MVLTILKEFAGEGSVASTVALVMGMSTLPDCSSGCPQASRCVSSMIGHGASAGNVHVAAHQDRADGGARLRAAQAASRC